MRENRPVLRVTVCGSKRTGKTTLVDRLVSHSRRDLDDDDAPLGAPEFGASSLRPQGLDFACLLLGLAQEAHETGAVDAGRRVFSTERHEFAVLDIGDEEPLTKRLLAAASTADLGILVVDASQGVQQETRRHALLMALVGIQHMVVAVDKMDLVDFSEAAFARIQAELRPFITQTKLSTLTLLPISSLRGENLDHPSLAMPWFEGPTLRGVLDCLETDEARRAEAPFRFRVGRTKRLDSGASGAAGSVLAGSVRVGDSIRVQPAGRVTRVARILVSSRDASEARGGQSIDLVLEDNVELARGDLIAASELPAEVADQFEASLVWLGASPLLPGRSYVLKIGAQRLTATVSPLKYRTNLETLERMAAVKLEFDEIGVGNLRLDQAIAFDAYRENRDTGGFVLLDGVSDAVVGAGMLHFALRRAKNVHWQAVDVNKAARSVLKGQKPCLLWYTGLSGAGKSAIANLVDKKLHALDRHTYLLDGDNVRHGLNKDLGFTDADRVENIRRIAEVAKLMVDAGLIVGAAFISPFRAERRMARALLADGEFIEIFVDTALAIAEQRDPKGLYKKARQGELKNFTGIDSPYEIPENPELRIDTRFISPEAAADIVIALLQARGHFIVG